MKVTNIQNLLYCSLMYSPAYCSEYSQSVSLLLLSHCTQAGRIESEFLWLRGCVLSCTITQIKTFIYITITNWNNVLTYTLPQKITTEYGEKSFGYVDDRLNHRRYNSLLVSHCSCSVLYQS